MNVVNWRIAVVEGSAIAEGVAAFHEVWVRDEPAPAITVHFVAPPATGAGRDRRRRRRAGAAGRPTREHMGRAVFAGSASSRRWSRPCSDPEEPREHQMSAHLS